ncbi:MAG: alpha/beta fold hydrolase [Candidatus Promineifilaceae bacterium]|nr:alpha/beta fold hydrolase [Candidatus Promineifilaceae bacterium]
MKQEIRFGMSYDGTRIAYAIHGQGYPLVRASTYLTHLEYDWNSPVWRHWLTDLGRHFTVIRHDQRGCGLSDWTIDNPSMNDWVADLETVVNSLDLERFALLGPSQGGSVAIEYAVRHPERISHLILYGAYGQGRFHRSPASEQKQEAEILLDLIRVGWGRDNPAFRQVFTTLFIPEGSPEQIEWFNDLQRITTSPENAVKMETAFYHINVSKSAQKVRTPTLVLHSREDAMVTFEEGRQLAALIPGARFVSLESKNHLLLAEEPAWEHFLNEVVEFISFENLAPVPYQSETTPLHHLDTLTKRESEVLELIAQGFDNQQIANRLFISQKTARNHVSNIYSKMGVDNRSQAIVAARQAGFGRNTI